MPASNKIIFIAIILLFTFSSVSAKLNLSFAPQFSYLNGKTEYSLDLEGDYAVITTNDTLIGYRVIRSLLEYPLDAPMGGVTVQLEKPDLDWTVNGSFALSLGNPGDKMLDSDWDGFEPHYPYTLWSYTESDVEQTIYQFQVDIQKRIFNLNNSRVNLMVGFKYQKIDQELNGIDGYQVLFDQNAVAFSDSIVQFSGFDGVTVLTYEITYKTILAGISADLHMSSQLSGNVQLLFSPTFYSDVDDHVLRKKLSVSDGDGPGFTGKGMFTYQFTRKGTQQHIPFISFGVEYQYIKAEGAQTQEWYEDVQEYDPIAGQYEDIPAGTKFGGIPHEIKSTQFYIHAQIGFKLF